MSEIVILGAGGFAKEVAWLLSETKESPSTDFLRLKGFISSKIQKAPISGPPILGDDQWAMQNLSKGTRLVTAIGNPQIRSDLKEMYAPLGFQFATLIHTSVRYSQWVQIGDGSILCAGSTLTVNVQIGQQVIINLHCTVGHDVVIEDFSTLAPGVHVSGGVHIEKGVDIGTGAVILPGIRLGEGCSVGAGAVVTKDLLPGKTYVGIPAKEL